jgi:hypothetical protein
MNDGHADVGARQLMAQGFGKAPHGELARRIGGLAGWGNQAE